MIDRKEIPSIVKKYTNVENYIFFLGNTDPKKNVPRTLKAYSLYLQYSNQKRPLLIADLKEDVLDEILKKLQIEHIKLHDTFIKILLLLVSAIFWWNPLMYILRKDIDQMLELRCEA